MTNKHLGQVIIGSYILAVVSYVLSDYTTDVTVWTQLAGLLSIVGFGVSIWGAIRLWRSK